MTSGYSGTPLAKKLGIKEGYVVAVVNEPDELRGLLDGLPDDVEFRSSMVDGADIVMMFFTDRSDFQDGISAAADVIFPDGAIWVAWPKKASNVPTDMSGNVIREVILPMGLVDNKVSAISDVWSGLRVVWRRENR